MAITDTYTPLSEALVKIHQAGSRPSYELSFRNLQNSMITRLNDKIDKIVNDPGPYRAQEELQRKMASVQRDLPLITEYTTANEHNGGKLETLSTTLADMYALFSRDDGDTNMTAAEATDINAARDDVVAKLNDLYILSHPDVTDGNVIGRLRQNLDAFSALTATTGVIDPSGTVTPTNDNRQLLDMVSQLISDVTVAQTVTGNTVELGLNMKLDLLAKMAEYDSLSTEITVVEASRRTQEIDNLKVDNANLLKAISLSFENAMYMSESIAASIQQNQNPPGSILNLFS